MRLTFTLVAASLLVAGACGGSNKHGVSTDPNGAIGFITSNAFVPKSAASDKKSGLPEDADGRPYTYELLGQPLPDFKAKTVGGGIFNSADIDQWTVINIWGLWCGDSLADAPFRAETAAKIALDNELAFFSMITPPSAERADDLFGKFGSLETYFDKMGHSYPTLLDTDASLRDLLKIEWTPSYLLVSPDGVVRGYRTDLSVAGDTPIDDFFADIAAVRASHAAIQPRVRKASIGPDGVDGLSGITPFRLRSIEAAFPNKLITAATETAEGDTYPVFNIANKHTPDKVLFQVWPNWDRGHVGFVETQNPDVTGPNGAQIGKLFFGELNDTDTQNCFAGAENYTASIICNIGDEHQFQYVFSPSRADEGEVLSEASSEIRARAVLSAMRYLPPTPETF